MGDDYVYTDHFTDSGQGKFYQDYYKWLEENRPGKGKYFKQMMRDPANSSLANASLATTARAQKLMKENWQVDPAIAMAAPNVIAQQQNEASQDIAQEGGADFMRELASTQKYLYGANQARKNSIYQTEAGAHQNELDERGRQMEARKKTNPWLKALGIASPFLSLIPGVGPPLAAAAGAAGSNA